MEKWTTLREVQPLVAKIMINSFQRNRVSHAYLIQGTRGTGKKSIAQLIALTLFCEMKTTVDPCLSCNTCKRIMSGNHPDVHWIEPDGRSIKTEQIKDLQTEFGYSGMESARKVYIITHAELLTNNAANRILKFLEEPEVETNAILLTDNVQAVIPTIRSRCQMLELQPLDTAAFIKKLTEVENLTINENNARFLSALTNNIDEAVSYHEEGSIYDIRDLVAQFIYTILTNYDERYLFLQQKWFTQLKDKTEQAQGLDLFILVCKDIINVQIGREKETCFFQPTDALLKRAANELTQKRLLRMLQSLLEAKQKLNDHVHPTLVMEQLVLQF